MGRSSEFMEGLKHRWGATVGERSDAMNKAHRDKSIANGWAPEEYDAHYQAEKDWSQRDDSN